jgi:hypothetical protein
VPFTVKLLEAEGAPIGVVKLPILDTEVHVLGGVEICNKNDWTLLLPALFLAVRFKMKLPPTVGVPEITPVAGFNCNPFEGSVVAL